MESSSNAPQFECYNNCFTAARTFRVHDVWFFYDVKHIILQLHLITKYIFRNTLYITRFYCIFLIKNLSNVSVGINKTVAEM